MFMESVMKKVFSGKTDEEVHSEFIKYSRGTFANRYLIKAKKQKEQWNIKTSSEFTNFFVKACLSKAKEDVHVKGAIICTMNIKEDIPFEIANVKQFMGVKQYVVDGTASPQLILDLIQKQPRAFYALSFSTSGCELKIKAKAPKNAKPSTKGDSEPKAGFCSLKTNDRAIVEDLFFDVPAFKEAAIKHTLQIDTIILPKGVNDPVQMREQSRRKGKIIREITIDGKKERKEKEFEA